MEHPSQSTTPSPFPPLPCPTSHLSPSGELWIPHGLKSPKLPSPCCPVISYEYEVGFTQTSYICVRLEFRCGLRAKPQEGGIRSRDICRCQCMLVSREAGMLPCPHHLVLAIKGAAPQLCGVYLKNFLATFPFLEGEAVGAFAVRCVTGWRGHAEEPLSGGRAGPAASMLGRWFPDACTISRCLGGPLLQPSSRSCSRRRSPESVSSAFQIFLQAIQYHYYIYFCFDYPE